LEVENFVFVLDVCINKMGKGGGISIKKRLKEWE